MRGEKIVPQTQLCPCTARDFMAKRPSSAAQADQRCGCLIAHSADYCQVVSCPYIAPWVHRFSLLRTLADQTIIQAR